MKLKETHLDIALAVVIALIIVGFLDKWMFS